MENPLLDDALVDLLVFDVFGLAELCALPLYADHDEETSRMFLQACRRLGRDVLFPTYEPMDKEPPRFEGGRVLAHPRMKELWPRLCELGIIACTRPAGVGGQGLPHLVATFGSAWLAAGNGSAAGYAGLTTGAAHLLEAFATEELQERYMRPLYEGRWTGTMALTEPQAGSGLNDVTTRATPTDEGHYLLKGSKIFISGADHDLTDNIVHMVLARIDGAPPGVKGISLFVVPGRRPEGDGLVANDVAIAGNIRKIGWKGIPSLALELGENDDCRGWLVGQPHQGLKHMFQMMNEARLMIGMNATATASVSYHQAVAYAQERRQGRHPTERDPLSPPIPIIEHDDVKRMLLRQKAIVGGSLALVGQCARYADLARAAASPEEREEAGLLLDLLTPVAKTVPSEFGFESCALSVQVHGGYGYSSEYLPEAWLRDQKLNSIHEGTTGIQGLDLLGRKAVAQGGRPLALLGAEIGRDLGRARAAGLDELAESLQQAVDGLAALTLGLGQRGLAGDVDGMLRHSTSYLELFGIVAVAWQWLKILTAAEARAVRTGEASGPLVEGARRAARYWYATELGRAAALADLIASGEDSYSSMDPAWF